MRYLIVIVLIVLSLSSCSIQPKQTAFGGGAWSLSKSSKSSKIPGETTGSIWANPETFNEMADQSLVQKSGQLPTGTGHIVKLARSLKALGSKSALIKSNIWHSHAVYYSTMGIRGFGRFALIIYN